MKRWMDLLEMVMFWPRSSLQFSAWTCETGMIEGRARTQLRREHLGPTRQEALSHRASKGRLAPWAPPWPPLVQPCGMSPTHSVKETDPASTGTEPVGSCRQSRARVSSCLALHGDKAMHTTAGRVPSQLWAILLLCELEEDSAPLWAWVSFFANKRGRTQLWDDLVQHGGGKGSRKFQKPSRQPLLEGCPFPLPGVSSTCRLTDILPAHLDVGLRLGAKMSHPGTSPALLELRVQQRSRVANEAGTTAVVVPAALKSSGQEALTGLQAGRLPGGGGSYH